MPPDNFTPERRAALERERAQSGGSRAAFYDTKNLTDDIIRLLPLEQSENIGTKWVTYFLNKKNYTCPEETPAYASSSVIAKARRALERLGTDAALAMAKSLKDARRAKWVMKIISRKDPMTPKWFESPYAIYKVVFEALEKDGYEVYHPNRGRDFRISKSGSGMGTNYSASIRDESQLAPTKEERDALRAKAREMDVSKLTAPNEAGALEALKTLIPPDLWNEIKAEVVGSGGDKSAPGTARQSTPRDGDDDAPSRGSVREDDDAPPPRTQQRQAAPPADDDAPPPRRQAPAAQDDDAPPPRRQQAAAPRDDDDAPPPRSQRAAAPRDDDDAPPPRQQRQAAPPADDDDEGARPAANGKRAVVVDDAPPPRTQRPRVQDDD